MAERAEGSGSFGGPYSRLFSPSSSKSRSVSGTESNGSSKNSLPLRKRKFAFTPDEHSENLPTPSATDPSLTTGTGNKRRKIGSSSSSLKTISSDSICSIVKENRTAIKYTTEENCGFAESFEIDYSYSKASTRKSTDPVPHNKRRSSRGSYPVGFYAEEEQRCLAAFRDHTSELKSKGADPGLVETRKSHSRLGSKSGAVAGKNTCFSRKMTDRPGGAVGNVPHLNVILSDKQRNVQPKRKARRHTLPGKGSSREMGVNLSKCLVSRSGRPEDQDTRDSPRASTSGLNAPPECAASSSSVIDQLMRRLPLKKKSNSEHDLQQIGEETSVKPLARESVSFRKHDERRRRQTNAHPLQKQCDVAEDSETPLPLTDLNMPWKRAYNTRKSPVASKKGKGKTNLPNNNSQSARGRGGTAMGSGVSRSLQSYNANNPRPINQGAGIAGAASVGIPLSPNVNLSSSSSSFASSTLDSFAGLRASGALDGINGLPGSSSVSATAGSLGATGGLSSFILPGESESDENEVGRLEALLAARGLPPGLFGALAPRMQHILHRSVSSSITSRAQQLLIGLQAADESEQLQAVIEMCQLLVMGNEDTLTGFPIKQVTPALIVLLNMEHNFDMMNHACRALTYMMEVLPRSSAVVVEAVPAFLEKLQAIQCMDVAEQALTALNMLSRKHSKSILLAHGVSACLTFLDFFSTNAQRAALSITANCFQNLSSDEFHFASNSLQILSTRLASQGDKKCLESVCLAYSRLVDCFQHDSNKLQEIASHDLLTNIQHLLVVSPPVLMSGTFIMVIRMMSVMCANCPLLAVTLLQNNIAQTLCYLLTNSTDTPQDPIELVSRSPQEMFEITYLISELMPALPSNGIFYIDAVIQRPSLAHHSGDYESTLCVNKNTYTLDLHNIQQINDSSGTVRSIQRKSISCSDSALQIALPDARGDCLRDHNELACALIKSLFSLLHEVYTSSAGPAVRYKCLRTMLRMVYFSKPDLLQTVLKSQAVSSHLAAMLSSNDAKIVVGAIQMTSLLIEKLPDVFAIYFRREGVMHQIKRLCEPDVASGQLNATPRASSPVQSLESSFTDSLSADLGLNSSGAINLSTSAQGAANSLDNGAAGKVSSSSQDEAKVGTSPQGRMYDAIRNRKRPGKGSSRSTGGWRKSSREETPSFSELLLKVSSAGASLSNSRDLWKHSGRSKAATCGSSSSSSSHKSSFLSSFNPVKWARSNSSPSGVHDSPINKGKSNLVTSSNLPSMNLAHAANNSSREFIKNWIREQADRLNKEYFSSELDGFDHPALTVLNRLIAAVQLLETEAEESKNALKEIGNIVLDSDISPFEVIHSGLVKALLNYLTSLDMQSIISAGEGTHRSGKNNNSKSIMTTKLNRENKILYFIHIFLGCSLNSLTLWDELSNTGPFEALITKLNGCVNQLEQFPVKVHDLPGNGLSGSCRGGPTAAAIKFFNTHQLKCNLQRHPDCSNLKQWKGGAVKVDPLALVQAIERYLVIRGYGRLREEDDDNSDDDNSDDDIDDTLAAVSVSQTSSSHKLQFLIGGHVLPYNMTVYQAIRLHSSQDNSSADCDTDSEIPVSQSSIWLHTHTIYYRPLQDSSGKPQSGRKGKSSKQSPKRKEPTYAELSILGSSSFIEGHMNPQLPSSVTVHDPSLEVLTLLRVLYSINRHYGTMYPPSQYKPALQISHFLNQKLTAKANRQLQDPLVIMTGNLPQWLPQIAYACPFMFPFETRQLLFYAVTFDRDRTLQRLMDASPELNSSDSSERVTPKLERKKRTVNRDDILKQAENVMADLATSRAMLEIQYENEVGTGLGPTLEFYALVSKELQKAELELWRGETVSLDESIKDNAVKSVKYVAPVNGLFPLPIARGLKSSQVSKIKAKFRFLGKLMAKAVMDSRMLDVRLHKCVYKWLLGDERSLNLGDVMSLDPVMGQTLSLLQSVFIQKKLIQEKSKADCLSTADTQIKIESLTVDGCKVEDLSLNFTLPGFPNIELKKGGSDTEVTINNIELYLYSVVEWIVREGVWKQMESLREGFESVFPVAQLQIFYAEELEQLFCGSVETRQWDIKQLADCCRPDHGYNHNSRAVKFLLQLLSSYNTEQQRAFLQFVTGSPRLPVGGFKSLSPPLTIVRKTFEAGENPDNFLPSVMTCVNYLKLPDYTTIDLMRAKLDVAAREGQRSFHLS